MRCAFHKLGPSNEEGNPPVKQHCPLIPLIAILALTMAASGCMTMARGTTEEVRIESNPTGAAIVVVKDGVTFDECSATPCTVTLKRKTPPFLVTFAKDGCQSQTLVLERKHATGKGLAGNLLGVGGVVGMGVDAASGAAYSITPNPLVANLDCG